MHTLTSSKRAEILRFYHPFNFLREIPAAQLDEEIKAELQDWALHGGKEYRFGDVLFYVKPLPWDTDFFGLETLKIIHVLHGDIGYIALKSACKDLLVQLRKENVAYVFMELPPEDIYLIQALNEAGMKSTETRLIYYHDNLSAFDFPRYGVRQATKSDIPALRAVAANMRNDYDRFHADPEIPLTLGDAFLAKYVEAGVNGYNDVVLVPNEPGVPSNAFFTANLLKKTWPNYPKKISKIVLTAASSLTNRGWHYKLFVETTYWLRDQGAEVVYMPTQSTNRAVIRNCEKLGYKYGGSFHVLTSKLS
jgi:dTDP-4-amino-4,6-dideoxy-D-galactose acyltransferase